MLPSILCSYRVYNRLYVLLNSTFYIYIYIYIYSGPFPRAQGHWVGGGGSCGFYIYILGLPLGPQEERAGGVADLPLKKYIYRWFFLFFFSRGWSLFSDMSKPLGGGYNSGPVPRAQGH